MAQGLEIKYSQFFDREAVLKKLSRKNRRVLIGTGAFYRRVVQRSMRSGGKRNKVAPPGQPPRWHTKALRQSIAFGYDARNQSVVVGAARINRGTGAAERLEYGGPLKRRKRNKRRRRNNDKYRAGRQYIEPRPFVGPKSVNYDKGEAKFLELTKKIPLR